MRLVDCILLAAGLLAMVVGFLGLYDWIDVAISIFVWAIGGLSAAVGMRSVLDFIRAKRQAPDHLQPPIGFRGIVDNPITSKWA